MQAARREVRGSCARPLRGGGFEGTRAKASPARHGRVRRRRSPCPSSEGTSLPARRRRRPGPASRASSSSSDTSPVSENAPRRPPRRDPTGNPTCHSPRALAISKPATFGNACARLFFDRSPHVVAPSSARHARPGAGAPRGQRGGALGAQAVPAAGRGAETAASAFQAAHASGCVPGVFT